MSRKILITGGNGLVGSAFENGVKITSRDANLINPLEAENVLRDKMFVAGIDSVIHTAAKVGGVKENISNQGTFFFENIMMNTNVINSCHKLNIERLICFLSTCIFPDDIEYPITERNIHYGPPHHSNYGYAYAKRMADIQIKAYREQYGRKYTSVIPTNIYGPNDNFNLESSHVVPALIRKCHEAKISNQPLVVWGTGKPLREFIFSKDVARLCEWMIENYDDSEPVILSNSSEISINELTVLICDIMGFKGDIRWDESKPDGQYRKHSDNSKLKSLLPDFQFTSIEKGLEDTINWFISNYDSARK